jgi:chromosome segregation ATPase
MEIVRASRAQDLAQIGAHAARIADLDSQLKTTQAHNRELEAALQAAQKTLLERTELLGSTESALHEMTERAQNWIVNIRDLMTEHEALGHEKEVQQGRVAAHEAKIADMHIRGAELEQQVALLRDELAEWKASAERLSKVDALLTLASRDLDATRVQAKALDAALQETRTRLAEGEQRRAKEVEHLESALRQARAESRDRADRLETTRADNALLKGSVEALRKEHLRQRNTAHGDRSRMIRPATEGLDERDVAALREALAEIGARMATLMDESAEDTPPSKRAL